MAEELTEQLTKYIGEAYAMEKNVSTMLTGMIGTTDDPTIKSALEQHREVTQQQTERLRSRLEAHGESPSTIKEVGGVMGALMKGVVDAVRGEQAGRNARDGYATEHLEIASYQLLERVAERAGDVETADVARQNRSEEEAMARTIESNWDRFADLALEEAGVAGR